MKKILYSGLIIFSLGCAKTIEQISAPQALVIPIQEAWIGDPNNDPRLAGTSFNLTQVDSNTLNQEQPVSTIFDCNGSLGNNNINDPLGVTENYVLVSSSDGGLTGTIQFGHLAYVGATNATLCSLFSKEFYTFEVINNGADLKLYSPLWGTTNIFHR